jgi:hypothetical protein
MFGVENVLTIAVKVVAVAGTIIYFIFSLVVVKQVTAMSHNVKDKFNGILIVFSYIHLLFSVLLMLLAWMLL